MSIECTADPVAPLASGFWYGTLRADVIDQCDGEFILLPLDDAIGKETPIPKVGVRLIGSVVKILRESDGWRGRPLNLRAITGQIIWMREEIEAIDNVEGALHGLVDLVLSGHSKHEIRGIVWGVGPSVIEVIFGIERLIADIAVEQSGCEFQTGPDGRKV